MAVAGGAHAGSGGVGGGGGGGGSDPTARPKLDDVVCLASCAGLRKVAPRGLVKLKGSNLRRVIEVSFNQEGGGRIAVEPSVAEDRAVKVRVPPEAATGKPRVVTKRGKEDTSPKILTIVSIDEVPEEGDFKPRGIRATPKSVYYFGTRDAKAKFSFDGAPTDIRVLVINLDTNRLVRTLIARNREPFVEHTVRWNGRRKDGKKAPSGRYRFKFGPRLGGPVTSSDKAKFSYRDHIFPVRAAHSYGDGLGAGRGHQGQDVFAKCGSPLVAARGGKVQWNRYHSAAGYYLVIDGKDTGRDYAYMHLAKKGRPREGSVVRTGERIGKVSDTGNASGCHLHFELWSAPGWYEGGHPTNPTDDLKAWDRYS